MMVEIDAVRVIHLRGGYHRGRYFGGGQPLFSIDVAFLDKSGECIGYDTVYVRAVDSEHARAVVGSIVERRGWNGLSLYR